MGAHVLRIVRIERMRHVPKVHFNMATYLSVDVTEKYNYFLAYKAENGSDFPVITTN